MNDRTTDLFEGIWPINDVGVSYNSYVIMGESVALIDLAKGIKTDDYLTQVEEVVDPSKIDYIIINHVEPDHTGVIKIISKLAPNATFVGTDKARNMITDFYQLEDTKSIKWKIVTSGDEINLGKEHTLAFYEAPYVHWPETMVCYEKNSHVLFSCDAFGSYGALSGKIFDDDKGVDQNFGNSNRFVVFKQPVAFHLKGNLNFSFVKHLDVFYPRNLFNQISGHAS